MFVRFMNFQARCHVWGVFKLVVVAPRSCKFKCVFSYGVLFKVYVARVGYTDLLKGPRAIGTSEVGESFYVQCLSLFCKSARITDLLTTYCQF